MPFNRVKNSNKCLKCNKTVYFNESIHAINGIYHKSCLKCTICNTTLNVRSCMSYNNKPYCNVHIPKFNKTLQDNSNNKIEEEIKTSTNDNNFSSKPKQNIIKPRTERPYSCRNITKQYNKTIQTNEIKPYSQPSSPSFKSSNIFQHNKSNIGNVTTGNIKRENEKLKQILKDLKKELRDNERNYKSQVQRVSQENETLKLQIQKLKIQNQSQFSFDNRDNFHSKGIKLTYKNLQLRNWLKNRDISANYFFNNELSGKGCGGIVMKSFISIAEQQKVFTVALKMIINFSDSTITLNKCANEFKILPDLLQLQPNIVRVLGQFISQPTQEMINFVDESIRDLCYKQNGVVKSCQFFILEYYKTSLKSIVNYLSEDKIIKYSIHLARGLLFLYESKIAHLDIKLDNLMISSSDDLVIVDFGVAGKVRDDGTVDSRLTIGGNANHLSPEVLNARNNGKDLPCEAQYSWELGIIIYEMLNKGEHPFDTYGLSNCTFIPELDLTFIPQKFHKLLKRLICDENNRISILQAWEVLETRFCNNSRTNSKDFPQDFKIYYSKLQ